MCIIRSMLALLGPLDLYLSYYRKGFQEEQSKSRLQPAVLMGVTPSSIPIISFPPICHQYSSMRLVLVCQAFERPEFFSQPSLQYAILSCGALSFQASLCSGSTPSIIHKICLSLLVVKLRFAFIYRKCHWSFQPGGAVSYKQLLFLFRKVAKRCQVGSLRASLFQRLILYILALLSSFPPCPNLNWLKLKWPDFLMMALAWLDRHELLLGQQLARLESQESKLANPLFQLIKNKRLLFYSFH